MTGFHDQRELNKVFWLAAAELLVQFSKRLVNIVVMLPDMSQHMEII